MIVAGDKRVEDVPFSAMVEVQDLRVALGYGRKVLKILQE